MDPDGDEGNSGSKSGSGSGSNQPDTVRLPKFRLALDEVTLEFGAKRY